MNAAPLKVAKIIYIFQFLQDCQHVDEDKKRAIYMFQRRGGTAKARTQFQNQFDAVARETALARILVGKISAG